MAKEETLFEESSQGAVGAMTAVMFILSAILMFGGFVLMGYGVNLSLGTMELWVFTAGLAATTLGFLIPTAILPAIGK